MFLHASTPEIKSQKLSITKLGTSFIKREANSELEARLRLVEAQRRRYKIWKENLTASLDGAREVIT